MSDGLLNLYTTLFVIVITVAGIAIAGVIALTQILQPLLTFKSTQNLLRGRLMIVTGVFLGLSLLASLIPMIALSLKSYNFIPGIDFHLNNLISNQWYAVVCVALFIVALVLLVWLVYRETRYLIPANALAFLNAKLKEDDIKKYFEMKYANPPSPVILSTLFRGLFDDDETEESAQNEPTEEELNKEYEKKLREYETNKKRAESMENPLLPLESYLTQSIRRNDLQTTAKTLQTIEELITGIASKKSNDSFLQHLVRYYSLALENAIELAASLGLYSFVSETIVSSTRLTDELIKLRKFNHLMPIQDLWQEQADKWMGVQAQIFKLIMSGYREAGEQILREKKIDLKEAEGPLDNVFRSLGWIGERLLSKGSPEKKAIMHSDYQTEFDALMNAVLAFGWPYKSDRPKSYPLIYFDCLYVIAKRLIPYYDPEDDETRSLSDTLFSLMYEHESFAFAAIVEKNRPGAELALMRLREYLEMAQEANLDEQVQYSLESVMRIGAYAAAKELTEKTEFMSTYGETIPEAAKAILLKHVGSHDLSKEAREITIKLDFYTKAGLSRKFLKDLGDALGTTFGMNLKA